MRNLTILWQEYEHLMNKFFIYIPFFQMAKDFTSSNVGQGFLDLIFRHIQFIQTFLLRLLLHVQPSLSPTQ